MIDEPLRVSKVQILRSQFTSPPSPRWPRFRRAALQADLHYCRLSTRRLSRLSRRPHHQVLLILTLHFLLQLRQPLPIRQSVHVLHRSRIRLG